MTTMYVGNNRLLKLADHLEQLPRSAIRMDSWVSEHTTGNQYVQLTPEIRKQLEEVSDGHLALPASIDKVRGCGFAACAVGWAGTIKSFKRAGFKVETGNYSSGTFDPSYDGSGGFTAVQEFFAVTESQAEYMFGPTAYGESARPRPSTVANRIRKTVAKRQAAMAAK